MVSRKGDEILRGVTYDWDLDFKFSEQTITTKVTDQV